MCVRIKNLLPEIDTIKIKSRERETKLYKWEECHLGEAEEGGREVGKKMSQGKYQRI